MLCFVALLSLLLCATSHAMPANLTSRAVASWTSPNGLPLNSATLNIKSGAAPTFSNAPDGKRSIKGFYPKGSYIPSRVPRGGFTFYAIGPGDVNLRNAREATFEYSVYFEPGFDFVKGGKLPGFYGGDGDDVAMHCSGGRDSAECWSARLMWRANGDGELYLYLPMSNIDPDFAGNDKICSIPNSHCNPDYGNSISRGAFRFATGQWTRVKERVRINYIGQYTAEVEVFINGKSVINVNGIKLRRDGIGKIRGMQWETFFGGSTVDWASPKDQSAYFSDIAVTIVEVL